MAGRWFSHLFLCLRWFPLALLLREDDVRALLPMKTAIDLVEEGFRSLGHNRAENLSRRRIHFDGGVFHVMAAAIPDRRSAGLKAYASTRVSTTFVALLFDAESGRLLAILEADWLGRIRTGAASGVATRLLARSNSRVAAVIGAGGQAETQIQALAALDRFELIKVFSRTRERREGLVRRLADEMPCRLVAVGSAREAVDGSDVVTTITNAADPVLEGAWLQEGCHVNAAGSNGAHRREIDTAAVERASCIAVDSTEQAMMESGDLIAAADAEMLDWDRVRDLGDIVVGLVPGRTSDTEITLFESQGVALEDVIAAQYVYERALEHGRGQRVDFGGSG